MIGANIFLFNFSYFSILKGYSLPGVLPPQLVKLPYLTKVYGHHENAILQYLFTVYFLCLFFSFLLWIILAPISMVDYLLICQYFTIAFSIEMSFALTVVTLHSITYMVQSLRNGLQWIYLLCEFSSTIVNFHSIACLCINHNIPCSSVLVNRLSGEIPEELGKMTNLTYLYVVKFQIFSLYLLSWHILIEVQLWNLVCVFIFLVSYVC